MNSPSERLGISMWALAHMSFEVPDGEARAFTTNAWWETMITQKPMRSIQLLKFYMKPLTQAHGHGNLKRHLFSCSWSTHLNNIPNYLWLSQILLFIFILQQSCSSALNCLIPKASPPWGKKETVRFQSYTNKWDVLIKEARPKCLLSHASLAFRLTLSYKCYNANRTCPKGNIV